MSEKSLNQLRQCARPVMFSTGVDVAPFAIKGSSFFVGYRAMSFVVTARHVIRSHEPLNLLFYPTSDTSAPVRIIGWWKNEVEPDAPDLFIARTTFDHLPTSVTSKAALVLLDEPGAVAWFKHRNEALFFVCGFPADVNEADYAMGQANVRQVLLTGRYVAKSSEDGVHHIKLENPKGIDFDGLSGSPIYCLMNREGSDDTVVYFCGMAIQGSASSSFVHFIDSKTILLALDEAVNCATEIDQGGGEPG